MDQIAHNWRRLEERIARAAESVGRSPAEIDVVAITKTRPAAAVEAAIRAGLRHVGENKVQEAEAKKAEIELGQGPAHGAAKWHFVGHLQTNKAGKAVALFDLVQSVDSTRLATALDRRAAGASRCLDILIQVNTSGAVQQRGVSPDELISLAEETAGLSHLRLRGLMTIAEHCEDERQVRSCFSRLRELGERLTATRIEGVDMRYLSMGMSADFELAIAEGANLVRLGTAIFGPRRD
jgi:pyridoxal phosphate enzyme (YggS family)